MVVGPVTSMPGEGGAPSLSDASRGMGSSLAGMSAGLGAMLSSASNTLTSAPSSSGSTKTMPTMNRPRIAPVTVVSFDETWASSSAVANKQAINAIAIRMIPMMRPCPGMMPPSLKSSCQCRRRTTNH